MLVRYHLHFKLPEPDFLVVKVLLFYLSFPLITSPTEFIFYHTKRGKVSKVSNAIKVKR